LIDTDGERTPRTSGKFGIERLAQEPLAEAIQKCGDSMRDVVLRQQLGRAVGHNASMRRPGLIHGE
jgi:hypothetical protein